MDEEPKAVVVKTEKTNPLKKVWSSITKKKSNNPKDIKRVDNPNKKSLKIPNLNKSARFWATTIIIFVLACGIFVIYKSQQDKLKKTTDGLGVKTNCSVQTTESCSVLKEAVYLLDPSKVKELSVVVDKIKNISGYDKNPNLLYVILTFYINLSDGENAKKTYELLNNSYKTDVGYDPLLVNAKKPAELESIINFLQKLSADVKKNSFTVPPEPQ